MQVLVYSVTKMIKSTSNASLSGIAGANNEITFGLGVSDAQNNTRYNGNISYLLPMMNVGSTISSDSHSIQYSLSTLGAVVGHRYGLTPVNSLPETYTIIHAKNGKGANVENAWGVKVDRFGNAIYPFNSAYSKKYHYFGSEEFTYKRGHWNPIRAM